VNWPRASRSSARSNVAIWIDFNPTHHRDPAEAAARRVHHPHRRTARPAARLTAGRVRTPARETIGYPRNQGNWLGDGGRVSTLAGGGRGGWEGVQRPGPDCSRPFQQLWSQFTLLYRHWSSTTIVVMTRKHVRSSERRAWSW
jgi:hypothetical protein